MNIDCPGEMTSSCPNQMFSDKQDGKMRVRKCVLSQKRHSKILESVLQDRADQRQLEGKHDFCRPRDIDELCLAWPDKHCCVNISTNRLTMIPSQGCDISILKGGANGCTCYAGPSGTNRIDPVWPLKTDD